MKGYIYKISNNVNDKVYIGKTLYDINKRFAEHKSDCKRRRCEKRPLYSAMNKYGVDCFSIQLVEEVDSSELSEREQYWIREYNSYHLGYNATIGGDGTQYVDYEKITQLYEQYHNMTTIQKITGHDLGTISKVVKSTTKFVHSEDVTTFYQGKHVGQYDIKTNELIRIYPSTSSAAKSITGSDECMSHIAACAKGKRKTAYAFKWKYMESQEFKDAPGLIVLSKNEVVKTPKVKKWIDKHNPTVYKILYLENPSNNFKELEKQLCDMEKKYFGVEISETKPKNTSEQRPYTHTYRVNVNTVLCAYSQEDLDRLKQNYI